MESNPEINAIRRGTLIATKRYLTAEEFARYFDYTAQFIRQLMRNGKLPWTRLWDGGPRVIDMQAFEHQDETVNQ